MVVHDHNNSGIPQLYMRTDKGFEIIDIFQNKEHSSTPQETSVVYTFCVSKLQVMLYTVNCILYYIILLAFNLKTLIKMYIVFLVKNKII